MNKRFIKFIVIFMAAAILLGVTGCGNENEEAKKDKAVDGNTDPNINKPETEPSAIVAASSAFEWEWCPHECLGVCQQDPCGPPPAPPTPVPDPSKVCNQDNMIAWLKKDMTIEKSIDDGNLLVAFDQQNNILSLKGKIHGANGSIRRMHFLLRHFQGKNPHIKSGTPCILKIRYSGK